MSENITINHTLPKTRFFGLHFCRRQYRPIFNISMWWPHIYRIWCNNEK